jgi:hypothetical protein
VFLGNVFLMLQAKGRDLRGYRVDDSNIILVATRSAISPLYQSKVTFKDIMFSYYHFQIIFLALASSVVWI